MGDTGGMDIDLDAIRQRDRQFGRLAYATQGDHDRRALLAEVDRLRAQLADAWEQGRKAGVDDQFRWSQYVTGDRPWAGDTGNPYR